MSHLKFLRLESKFLVPLPCHHHFGSKFLQPFLVSDFEAFMLESTVEVTTAKFKIVLLDTTVPIQKQCYLVLPDSSARTKAVNQL